MDALRTAEASLQESSSSSSLLKDLLRSEMDDEDNNAWHDEDAAQKIAYRETGRSSLGADRASDDGSYEDDILQELQNNAELKDGKAVGLLLAKDKKTKGAVTREDRPLGIVLWIPRHSSTELEPDVRMLEDRLPPLRFVEADVDRNALLTQLERSVDQAGGSLFIDKSTSYSSSPIDVAEVTMIINSGSLALLKPQYLGTIKSWLFELGTTALHYNNATD